MDRSDAFSSDEKFEYEENGDDSTTECSEEGVEASKLRKDGKNTHRTLRTVFLVFLASVGLLSFVTVIISLLYCYTWSVLPKERSQEMDSMLYRYYRYNEHTKTSSVGFTKTTKLKDENDFLFYENDVGDSFLISNFGTNEYKCRGTCVCENNDLSRRLSKGVEKIFRLSAVFLITAANTAVALDMANVYFEEKCQEKIAKSQPCPSDWISSFVDDCEPIHIAQSQAHENQGKENPKVSMDEIMFNEEFENAKMDRYFMCTGRCLRFKVPENSQGFSEYEEYENMARKFGCEKLDFTLDDYHLEIPNEEFFSLLGHVTGTELAESLFVSNNLHMFCATNSMTDQESSPDQADYKPQFPLCVGYVPPDKVNPTVRCVETRIDKK